MLTIIEQEIREHQAIIEALRTELAAPLSGAAALCGRVLNSGGKLLFCGNGGSAADSQHLAAELVGRFRAERGGLFAVALTTDTSILTAVGNDYGFDRIFARQVEALGQKGDVLIGLSTSGNSENVLQAMAKARETGIKTIGMTGGGGGKMRALCDICLSVPSADTARIQEGHILIGHILCELLDTTRDG